MEKQVVRSIVFWVGIALLAGTSYAADEPAGTSQAGDLSEFSEILAKFETEYAENGGEAVAEIPFCKAVIQRKQQESIEVLQAALKDNSALLKLFNDMEHFYPNGQIFQTRAPISVVKDTEAKGEGQEKLIRPVFFGPDTQVFYLRSNADGSFVDQSGPIKDVKKEDYVLSTTAHLIDDPRYHKTCWAKVLETRQAEMAMGGKLGSVHYWGKQGDKQKVVSTLDPLLRLYSIHNGENGRVLSRLACQELPPGAELFSPKEKAIEGVCRYAIYDDTTTASAATPVFNLDIELTGVYFIGPLGSQILVHH